MFNNWLIDIPKGQYPSVISSDRSSDEIQRISIVDGYNNAGHCSLGKSPNDMTQDDVNKLAAEKRKQLQIHKYYSNLCRN